jgi:preprotein translocase subunit SecG
MDEEILAKLRKAAIIGAFFGLALLFFALGWHAALKIYVIVVGFFATLAILIQSGKGGGLAASLGGLGGESLLGVRSATPIAKATYVMLALFIFICMLTAILGPARGKGRGLLDTAGPTPAPVTLPQLPAGGTIPPIGPQAPLTPEAPGSPQTPAQSPAEQPAAAPPVIPAPAATAPATPGPAAPSPQPGGAPQP